MKKSFHFVAFFVSSIVFFSLVSFAAYQYCQFRQKDTVPAIIIEPTMIDFGPVGEKMSITNVRVTNTSKHVISIVDIAATCSCSQVMLEKGDFLPGESRKAEVSLSTVGRTEKVEGRIGILYRIPSQGETLFLSNIDLKAEVKSRD